MDIGPLRNKDEKVPLAFKLLGMVLPKHPTMNRIDTIQLRSKQTRGPLRILLLVSAVLFGPTVTASSLEEGEITGTIEKANEAFLKDYEKLDYGSNKEWEDWGIGLKSLGWVVVRGDSGEPKDYLLLVIDTRTEIESNDSAKSLLADLEPGTRIEARYRMGWDAFHAIQVKKGGGRDDPSIEAPWREIVCTPVRPLGQTNRVV